jgi:hypothetical protein
MDGSQIACLVITWREPWGCMALVLLLLLLQLFFTSFTTTTELQSATHSKHTIYKQKCKVPTTDPAL